MNTFLGFGLRFARILVFFLLVCNARLTFGQAPVSRRDNVSETIHGIAITDPYRWLEDADSAETKAWVGAENALTEKYLSQIPARERIRRGRQALR